MADELIIEGRLVKLTQRNRQVVKIRAPKSAGKLWEYVFEIAVGRDHVSRSDIGQHSSIAELVDWLISRGADPVEDYEDIPLLSVPPPADWLRDAMGHVNCAVDRLIDSFRARPYLHRVEHSLHLHLYDLLVETKFFDGLHPIGGTGEKTQLIHKEWPETRPRPDKGGRGNFDFALLAPLQLADAALDQFAGGHIEAAIIIEVGLNYDYGHLAGDHEKLVESEATAGYLVDLRRVGRRDDKSEKLICNLSGQVAGAYAYISRKGEKSYKHVKDTKVTDD